MPGVAKKDHWLIRFQQSRIVRPYVRKVKHVSLDKSLFDLLIGPVNEQFVVEIGFFRKAAREVDRVLQTSSIPIGF